MPKLAVRGVVLAPTSCDCQPQSPLLQTPEGNVVGGNTIARFLAQAGSVKGLTGTSAYHTVSLEQACSRPGC